MEDAAPDAAVERDPVDGIFEFERAEHEGGHHLRTHAAERDVDMQLKKE